MSDTWSIQYFIISWSWLWSTDKLYKIMSYIQLMSLYGLPPVGIFQHTFLVANHMHVSLIFHVAFNYNKLTACISHRLANTFWPFSTRYFETRHAKMCSLCLFKTRRFERGYARRARISRDLAILFSFQTTRRDWTSLVLFQTTETTKTRWSDGQTQIACRRCLACTKYWSVSLLVYSSFLIWAS